MEKFRPSEDNLTPEEKAKEEERLGIAFKAVSEGDLEFAKELGVNFKEGAEEEWIEKYFNEPPEEQGKKELEQKETFQKKDSSQELFFQVLAGEHPDLGINIEDAVNKVSNKKLDGFYTVSMKISNENRNVLQELYRDEALNFLKKDNFNREDFDKVLDNKILPEDVAIGLLARTYAKDPQKYELELSNMRVGPITNDELKKMMSEYINRILLEK